MSAGLENLYRQTNQSLLVGNQQAPDMSGIDSAMLNAASSGSINLVKTTKISKGVSDSAAAKCRSYQGIDGLRQLQKDQANRSYYDAGCGWRYKAGTGISPAINQGAAGNAKGPIIGSVDQVSGGTKWFWDLDQAEQDITTALCANVNKCSQLSYLGQNADFCGYCQTTGAVIPVEKGRGGSFYSRYRDNSSLTCDPDQIVTASTGACPSSGFQDFSFSSLAHGLGVQGDLGRAFGPLTGLSQRAHKREGFQGSGTSIDALDNCSPPLTRDCVILAARMAGCSDDGSLIDSLSAVKGGEDYDTILKKKAAFTAYKESANPGITKAVLKDGSVAVSTALDDFTRLMKDSQSPTQKLRLASQDLCIKRGAFLGDSAQEAFTVRRAIENFDDGYDICQNLRETTIINSQNFFCLTKIWKNFIMGSQNGYKYPKIEDWQGKTFMDYLTFIMKIYEDAYQGMSPNIKPDKLANANAFKALFGFDSYNETSDLPRDATTRGAETVWIDLINNTTGGGGPAIILRCDLKLTKDGGEILPSINAANEFTYNYGVLPENNAFTSAFEMRPDIKGSVELKVSLNGGFMVGFNQNPFENTVSKSYDWGSWMVQGPTTYQSGQFPIASPKENTKNVFVLKWFQAGGGATFKSQINSGNGWQDINAAAIQKDIYLTQEPLAPWLQYEICSRPNNQQGVSTGLYEKRWNGAASLVYKTGTVISSFDVEAKSVVFQTDMNLRSTVPMRKGYASFITASSWKTKNYFAYNAFKTVTMLVRPMATPAVGQIVCIFHHINVNPSGLIRYSIGVYFLNNGNNNYSFSVWIGSSGNGFINTLYPATPNEWNLLVIQYGSDIGGTRGINFDAAPLTVLQSPKGLTDFSNRLRSKQSFTGPYILGNPSGDRANSGVIVLGDTFSSINWGGNPGFTGDIAWLHGFRNFLDTEELLATEVKQSWMSRWPNKNLTDDK